MRRILLFLGLLIGLYAPLRAQSIDEILSKNAQAHGGLEKIKSVSSMKLTGKIQSASGSEVAFILQKKRPNLLRIDSTFRGKKSTEGYDGTSAWETSLIGDTVPLAEDDVRDVREDAEFDSPLIDYRQKGNSIELMGKEDVNGTAVYKLKVTQNDGNTEYFYLDTRNGLELKQTTKARRDGKEVEMNIFFSDYRQVNSLTLPFSIKSKTQGKPDEQITIEKVETNPAIDDSIFRMPTPAPSQ